MKDDVKLPSPVFISQIQGFQGGRKTNQKQFCLDFFDLFPLSKRRWKLRRITLVPTFQADKRERQMLLFRGLSRIARPPREILLIRFELWFAGFPRARSARVAAGRLPRLEAVEATEPVVALVQRPSVKCRFSCSRALGHSYTLQYQTSRFQWLALQQFCT